MVEQITRREIVSDVFTPGAAAARSADGEYRGERITARQGDAGMNQSIQEEITMSIAHRVEKKFQTQRLKSSSNIDRVLRKEGSELLGPFPDKQKLVFEIAAILLSAHNRDPKAMLAKLHKLAPDAETQFLVLATLVKAQQQRNALFSIAAQRFFEDELKRLWKKNKERIQAAINVSPLLSEFVDQTGLSAAELRKTYVDTICDYGGLTKTYKKLIEQFGHDNLKDGVEFLLAGMGADLRSDDRSMPRNKLVAIVNDMSKLKVIIGVREKCAALAAKVTRRDASPTQLGLIMDYLLDSILGGTASEFRLTQVLSGLGIMALAEQITFTQRLRWIITELPVKVFKDLFARNNLLESISEILDEYISREEEEEDEDEDNPDPPKYYREDN